MTSHRSSVFWWVFRSNRYFSTFMHSWFLNVAHCRWVASKDDQKNWLSFFRDSPCGNNLETWTEEALLQFSFLSWFFLRFSLLFVFLGKSSLVFFFNSTTRDLILSIHLSFSTSVFKFINWVSYTFLFLCFLHKIFVVHREWWSLLLTLAWLECICLIFKALRMTIVETFVLLRLSMLKNIGDLNWRVKIIFISTLEECFHLYFSSNIFLGIFFLWWNEANNF